MKQGHRWLNLVLRSRDTQVVLGCLILLGVWVVFG